MSPFSWAMEEGSHKCLSQVPRTRLNPICCFAKEEKKKLFRENFPLFMAGIPSGRQGCWLGRTNSAAADALMQHCQQCSHAEHINSSLCGHGTPTPPFQSRFLSFFLVFCKAGEPKPACPLAQLGCSPLPTGNPPTLSWREPPHAF